MITGQLYLSPLESESHFISYLRMWWWLFSIIVVSSIIYSIGWGHIQRLNDQKCHRPEMLRIVHVHSKFNTKKSHRSKSLLLRTFHMQISYVMFIFIHIWYWNLKITGNNRHHLNKSSSSSSYSSTDYNNINDNIIWLFMRKRQIMAVCLELKP